MSTPFKRGHCLHCDLAAAVNAWGLEGGVKPSQLMADITGVLAYAAVACAKPGKLAETCAIAARLTAEQAQAIAAGDLDRKSIHAPGHA